MASLTSVCRQQATSANDVPKLATAAAEALQQAQQPVTAANDAARNPQQLAAADPSSSASLSPRHKSASAAFEGVLLINAKAGSDTKDGILRHAEPHGVLPSHLLVEESAVSYSPLSEHALSSPFMTDAHRQQLLAAAATPRAVSEPDIKSRMSPPQLFAVTEGADTSKEQGLDTAVKRTRKLSFAE